MTASPQSTQALINYVSNTLIVKQLQNILKATGQPSSGLKKTLQDRLIDRILELSRTNDQAKLEELRAIIYKPDGLVSAATTLAVQRPAGYGTSSATNGGDPYYNAPHTYGSAGMNGLNFKPSPFYIISETLTPIQTCPIPNHRHVVSTTFQLTANQLHTINSLKQKVMVYCTQLDPTLGTAARVDIAFPQQVELRVNNVQVQANLRGLKNKPGSTRPADITNQLIKTASYKNAVQLTYAHTHKKFAFVVNLVSHITVESLVKDLQVNKSRISKQAVINDMVKANNDSDLMATSSVMSLKCPLSTLRIDVPIRSRICTHVQCFDASSFLQLQQQAPTWTCPTCNKSIPYELLVVDSYVQDILDTTPKTLESVTIDPNGQWSVASQETISPNMSPDSDDDQDVIEITDTKPDIRLKTPKAKQNDTPPSGPASAIGREDASNRSSSKRPTSQIIDLTLTDDEDYESVRPAKRQHTDNSDTPLSQRVGLQFNFPQRTRLGDTPSSSDSYEPC